MLKLDSIVSAKWAVALRYGTAVLSVSAAVIGAWLMQAQWQDSAPVALFLIAIIISTWLGGTRPGLLALALSLLAFMFLCLLPPGSAALKTRQVIPLVALVVASSFFLWMTAMERRAAGGLRRAHDDQRQEKEALQADNLERKRIEEALRESERKLKEAEQLAHIGYWERDLIADRITWSEETCRLFGWHSSIHVLSQAELQKIIHPDDRQIQQQALAAAMQGRRLYDVEYRVVRLDGEVRFVHVRDETAYDATGRAIRMFGTVQDITEHKRAEEALRVSEQSLHQLSGQLLRLQDEERRRRARELHDTTAQKLVVLLLDLKRLAAQATPLDAKAGGLLAECQALAQQCADELRTFAYLLQPPLLEELGLAAAVRDYADGFAQRSGLRVDLEVSPGLERLPPETELALFRVLQESLTNVHRHSGSKTVSIRLLRSGNEVRLEVQDAGRGLELKTESASGEKVPTKLGVGIAGMRERLRQLGGRLEIESEGQGTKVRASLRLSTAQGEYADDNDPDRRRS